VLPDVQGKGIGRALLELAFPAGRSVRSIVATADVRAQARYYAAGMVARFPIYTGVHPTRRGQRQTSEGPF
jgi:GNAT superfamily N-acetyltransferase